MLFRSPDLPLAADANGSLAGVEPAELARWLDPLQLRYVEQPYPADDLASPAELRRRSLLYRRRSTDQLGHRLIVFGEDHFLTWGQTMNKIRQTGLSFMNTEVGHFLHLVSFG